MSHRAATQAAQPQHFHAHQDLAASPPCSTCVGRLLHSSISSSLFFYLHVLTSLFYFNIMRRHRVYTYGYARLIIAALHVLN